MSKKLKQQEELLIKKLEEQEELLIKKIKQQEELLIKKIKQQEELLIKKIKEQELLIKQQELLIKQQEELLIKKLESQFILIKQQEELLIKKLEAQESLIKKLEAQFILQENTLKNLMLLMKIGINGKGELEFLKSAEEVVKEKVESLNNNELLQTLGQLDTEHAQAKMQNLRTFQSNRVSILPSSMEQVDEVYQKLKSMPGNKGGNY